MLFLKRSHLTVNLDLDDFVAFMKLERLPMDLLPQISEVLKEADKLLELAVRLESVTLVLIVSCVLSSPLDPVIIVLDPRPL